jgi:hypothetical protein
MYLIESYPGVPKSYKSSYYKQKIDDILSTVNNINNKKYYLTTEDKNLLYLFYLRKILHNFCSHHWKYYMYRGNGKRYVDPLAVLKFCIIGYEQAATNCNIGSSSDYTSIEYYYKDILNHITFIDEDGNIVVKELVSSFAASAIIKLIKNAYYYCDFDLVSYMLYFDPAQNNGIRFDIYHEYPSYNIDDATTINSENLSKLQKAITHVAYSDFVDLDNINTIGYIVRRKSLSFIENYYLSIDIPEDKLSYNVLNMYEFIKYQNIMNEITLEPNYHIDSEEMTTEYLSILSLLFGQNAVFTILNELLCRRYANVTAVPTTKDGILLAYSSKYDIVYNTDRETLLQGKLFSEIKNSDKIVVLREKEENKCEEEK